MASSPATTREHPAPLPTVSVVIRNRNEARYLVQVLEALRHQELRPAEVIVVDNESSDDSVAVARAGGATVVPLARAAFTYGHALNVGISHTTGEVCVILSAHALPLGPGFLSACTAPFADLTVAAARCVHVGKSTDLRRWCAPESLGATASVDDVVSKGPLASGCAIRRAVWEALPFDEHVIAAEEKIWAAAALARGHRIISPCPAFYAYLKPLTPAAARRKNFRELIAVHQLMGERLGELRGGFPSAVRRAIRTIGVRIPARAVRQAHCEVVGLSLHAEYSRTARRGEGR